MESIQAVQGCDMGERRIWTMERGFRQGRSLCRQSYKQQETVHKESECRPVRRQHPISSRVQGQQDSLSSKDRIKELPLHKDKSRVSKGHSSGRGRRCELGDQCLRETEEARQVKHMGQTDRSLADDNRQHGHTDNLHILFQEPIKPGRIWQVHEGNRTDNDTDKKRYNSDPLISYLPRPIWLECAIGRGMFIYKGSVV